MKNIKNAHRYRKKWHFEAFSERKHLNNLKNDRGSSKGEQFLQKERNPLEISRFLKFLAEREEVQMFGKELQEIRDEQYLSDIKEYDIYNSYNDDATTCANIIVEPIAFVENGVGNPGGVYRRTISRYDSHYASQLMERFNKQK